MTITIKIEHEVRGSSASASKTHVQGGGLSVEQFAKAVAAEMVRMAKEVEETALRSAPSEPGS